MKVLITGAAGNLGRKLAEHLEASRSMGFQPVQNGVALANTMTEESARTGSPCYELTLLDRVAAPGAIAADLSVWNEDWVRHFANIDVVVHLAGNPVAYHDWPELIGPHIDAVVNVFEAAARQGVRRVIFASSNHVMGGYQDEPDIPITEDLPPRPGLRYFADGADRFSGAYAATKLFGERLGRHFVAARGLEVIAIRIGWVWRGVNVPSALPVERGEWFRNMWLSDRDYLQLMTRAIVAPLPTENFLVVNGMSNNTGSRWSQSLARNALGYLAQDDVAHSLAHPSTQRDSIA